MSAGKKTDLSHTVCCPWVRALRRVLIDLFAGNGRQDLEELWRGCIVGVVVICVVVGWDCVRNMDLADGRNESDDLDPISLLEVLFSDRSCSNTA